MQVIEKKQLDDEGLMIINRLKREFKNKFGYTPQKDMKKVDPSQCVMEFYKDFSDLYHLIIRKEDKYFRVGIRQLDCIGENKIGYSVNLYATINPDIKYKINSGELFCLPLKYNSEAPLLARIGLPEIEGATGCKKGNKFTRSYTLLFSREKRLEDTIKTVREGITSFVNSMYSRADSKFEIQKR